MANEQTKNNTAATKPPATPASIGETALRVASILGEFSLAEQGRIIHAAATINGLNQNKSK